MTTAYACTYVVKDAEEDHYDGGCDPKTRTCVLSEAANITAHSLPDLLRKLEDRYFLGFDSLFLHEDGSFGFSRLETNDCEEPNEAELAEWREGTLKLFLCDYYFRIEKRVVSDVDPKEYVDAGIKFHS